MPKPNIDLLKRLRTRFLRMRHPEHFNMLAVAARTECGSAMCLAGHTLDLAGYKMRLRADADKSGSVYIGRLDYDFLTPAGRKVRDPLVTAGRELGLRRGVWFKVFHDFSLKTPKQAADRVQELIESAQSK